MASYELFTSARTTSPDPVALVALLRTALADAATGVSFLAGSYTVKKTTPFSAADLTATQTAIDTAPAITPQRAAQNEIDNWPIAMRAFAVALVKQLNVIRAALPTPLPPLTQAQVLAAIRNEAANLS